MKRILLILILLISVSTAYAEPQICFDKKDSSNIVVQLEKYDICKEKNIAFNNMSIELQHQIDILNEYKLKLETQISNSDNIIKQKDDLLVKQEESCRIEVEAVKPTWGDRSMWAGFGAIISTIIIILL